MSIALPEISDNRFSEIASRCDKMMRREEEFCQSRSNHQIEKFIAGDEYTPITKFRLVSHNSFVCLQEVRRLLIDRERNLRRIKNNQILLDKHKEDTKFNNLDLDNYEIEIQLNDIEIRVKGLLKEIDYMEQICDRLEEKNGKPFTNEQLQEEEPEYWRKRLSSQMARDILGNSLGVGSGNIASYLQSIEKPILDNSKLQTIPFNIRDVSEIIDIAFKDREGLKDNFLKYLQQPNN